MLEVGRGRRWRHGFENWTGKRDIMIKVFGDNFIVNFLLVQHLLCSL